MRDKRKNSIKNILYQKRFYNSILKRTYLIPSAQKLAREILDLLNTPCTESINNIFSQFA